MKNMTRVWWGVGGVIVVGLLVWAGNFGLQLYQQWSQQRYIASVEVLKAEYRNDTYGGATPEETLRLFITAFKASDLELASKYFIIEKQAEYLAKMQNWVKLGKGEEVIGRISETSIHGNIDSGYVSMDAQLDDSEIPYSIELVRNEDTQKWKLNNM